MLKVGLTGSIAVGKTYVCEVFVELGAFVSDADVTAREVVQPNTSGLRQIVEHFDEDILQPNGELDREKLGEIVFGDESKRQLLNSIVHPLVIEAQDKWLRAKELDDPKSICIIDAALMIESGGYERFDKLIVVWCDSVIQLERLMLRNNLSESEALMRIDSQMPQEAKKLYGDFLIDTSDGFDSAHSQTIEIFNQFRSINPRT